MSDDLDGLPLDWVTRKVWEDRAETAETAAESNHYLLALRQDDRLREVIAALREARAEVERLRPKEPKVKVEIYPAPQREIIPIRVACPRCGHR